MNYRIGMTRVGYFFSYFFFFVLISAEGICQQKYWVLFKDKELNAKAAISEKCKENRRNLGIPETQITDLPVNPAYINELSVNGIPIASQSKWLNAISCRLSYSQIQYIKSLPFVQEIIPIDSKLILAKLDPTNKPDLHRTIYV